MKYPHTFYIRMQTSSSSGNTNDASISMESGPSTKTITSKDRTNLYPTAVESQLQKLKLIELEGFNPQFLVTNTNDFPRKYHKILNRSERGNKK